MANTRQVNPWILAPIIAIAAFMEVLDLTIANVSLMHIAGGLSATKDEATWVLTSYTVANAIILPISGWLSSRLGRKRYFMFCITGFSLTSLVCGMAPSLTILVIFRTLQGLAGGGLQPASQAILTDAFPPAKRGMAFALFGVAVVFAPAIGPTLGGWITDNYSWHWVFLINVPVGLILLPLVKALVSDPEHMAGKTDKKDGKGFRVDYIGFGLMAVGLGALQIMLDRGQQDDWFSSHIIAILAAAAAIGLVAFVIWEWYDDDPIVDIHLFRDRNFATSNVFMLVLGFILAGSTVMVPLFVQTLLGYSALQAGLVLTPGGASILIVMPIVGLLVDKVSTRLLIGFGFLMSGIGAYCMVFLSLQSSFNSILWVRLLEVFCMPFLFIPVNVAAIERVSPEKTSNASAIINLSRNVGSSIGVSICAAILARRSQFHQNRIIDGLTPYNDHLQHHLTQLAQSGNPANLSFYHEVLRQASMLGYLDVFKIMALMLLLMLPLVFLLNKGVSRSVLV